MKHSMKTSVLLAAAALTLAGCGSTSTEKMAKNREEIMLIVTPEILTLNNGQVAADITVSFPGGYFDPQATMRITPVIVFAGGEVAGTPKYLQGERVRDNYTVISRDGGTYNQHVEFPYDERMNQCTLQLRAEVRSDKGKYQDYTPVNLVDCSMPTKAQMLVWEGRDTAARMALAREFGLTVAYGLNTLQSELQFDGMMSSMADNYKKVTTQVERTDLMYDINSSTVTASNRRKAGLDDFKQNVDRTLDNDRASQSIAVKGYASPDGPEKLNDQLSRARSESGRKVIADLLKNSGLDIDAAAYGEDWDGFRELVEKSDIEDKNLILQVLSLYNSSAEREAEIKNLSEVFKELKEQVLPELRRAQIINTIDVEGMNDEEIMEAYRAGRKLSLEEYLYASERLTSDPATQLAMLTTASKHYKDARIYNNIGVLQSQMGDKQAALRSFEQAARLDSSAELSENLLLANLAVGNTAEARKYAAAAGSDARAALAAAEGDYKSAAKDLTGYNAAIAYVLSNNLTAAKRALEGDTSADADYLRAVIACKMGDQYTAKAELKSAVKKNPALAEKAAKDINLRALR